MSQLVLSLIIKIRAFIERRALNCAIETDCQNFKTVDSLGCHALFYLSYFFFLSNSTKIRTVAALNVALFALECDLIVGDVVCTQICLSLLRVVRCRLAVCIFTFFLCHVTTEP